MSRHAYVLPELHDLLPVWCMKQQIVKAGAITVHCDVHVSCRPDPTLPAGLPKGSRYLVATNLKNNAALMPHFILQLLKVTKAHTSATRAVPACQTLLGMTLHAVCNSPWPVRWPVRGIYSSRQLLLGNVHDVPYTHSSKRCTLSGPLRRPSCPLSPAPCT